MNTPQAKAVIALLSAAFPREPMPDSTVEMWAAQMTEIEYEDAKEAVSDLLVSVDRMPSLNQLLLAARQAKVDRYPELPDTTPEGPTFREWLDENPEYRKRLDGIGAGGPPAEEKTSRRDVSKSITQVIRQTAQTLDRPQSSTPRKRSECAEHQFFLRDRCYWCGAPQSVDA